MNTAIDTTSYNAASAARGAAKPASGMEETKTRFLSLLVAQMRNQDPLNPLDNAQVTSQLAQLSTVQGIETMNKTLLELADRLGADQLAQAASLIGRDVLVPGKTLHFDGEGNSRFGVDLDTPADTVKVSVFDAGGRLVSAINAGALGAGEHLFAWDGIGDDGSRVAAGEYRIEISATGQGKAVATDVLAVGRVLGAARADGGTELNVQGPGKSSYTAVRQVL